MKSIAVFCGASKGQDQAFEEAARFLGRLVAERGYSLVYGGGRTGLMGVLADAALAAKGRVVGVMPSVLVDKELAHRGIQDLQIVKTMHERKARIVEISDAFVVLPGGLGTLDEMFEVWTWAQLGFHSKPYGLLNVGGYFDSLIAFLDKSLLQQGFIESNSRQSLLVETTPSALLDKLAAHKPRDISRSLLKAV